MIDINELLSGVITHKNQGFAVFYYENGESISKCSGKLIDKKRQKVNFSTNFRLASVTKQFIAYAIVDLIHNNKLSYDTKVLDIYPQLPKYFNNITIKNLLNHTSGIYNYESIPHTDTDPQI